MAEEEMKRHHAPRVIDGVVNRSGPFPDHGSATGRVAHDDLSSVSHSQPSRTSSFTSSSETASTVEEDGSRAVRGKAPSIPLKKTTTRPGKKANRDGWAKLPMEILHRIMDHVERDVDVPPVLRDTWGRKASTAASFMLIELVCARRALCTLREVCCEWTLQIDKHPFWMRYVVCFDTTRRAHPVYDDLAAGAIVPRTPTFVSHFDRAQRMTGQICHICRINRPDQTTHAQDPECTILTTHLYHLPTCADRVGVYCAHCLIDDVGLQRNAQGEVERRGQPVDSGHGPRRHYGVSWVLEGDIDEDGQMLPTPLCCGTCRYRAIYNEMRRIIEGPCRRDGPLWGLEALASVPNTTSSAQSYISRAIGTARDTALLALDERFLSIHARWMALEDAAFSLQDSDAKRRDKYFEMQAMQTEEDRRQRWRALAKMYGEEVLSPALQLQDDIEVRKLYVKWGQEALGKKVLVMDLDDEEEDEEDGSHLSRRWTKKLREGVINDWINDRIRRGFWVSPEDEIAQIATSADPPIHAPIRVIAESNVHPFNRPPRDANARRLSPVAAAKQPTGTGWIDLINPETMQANCFLPTPALAEAMETRFAQNLRFRLWQPLQSVVRTIQALSPSPDRAATACQQMSLDALLRCLTRRETWTKPPVEVGWSRGSFGGDTGIDRKVKGRDLLMEVDEDGAPGKDVVDVLVMGEDGPRIELVMDDTGPGDYAIRQSWTSSPPGSSDPSRSDPSDMEGIESESPALLSSDTEYEGVEGVEVVPDDSMPRPPRPCGERNHEVPLAGAAARTLGKRKEAPGEVEADRGRRPSPKAYAENFSHPDFTPSTSVAEEDGGWMYVDPPTSSSVDMDERSKGTSETSSGPNILTPEDEASAALPDPPKLPATEEKAGHVEIDRLSASTESLPASSPSLPPVYFSSDADTDAESGSEDAAQMLLEGAYQLSMSKVPWIPTVKGEMLGPRAGKIIMDCWFEAWAPLRRCDCSVCVRRRTWDSWTERS